MVDKDNIVKFGGKEYRARCELLPSNLKEIYNGNRAILYSDNCYIYKVYSPINQIDIIKEFELLSIGLQQDVSLLFDCKKKVVYLKMKHVNTNQLTSCSQTILVEKLKKLFFCWENDPRYIGIVKNTWEDDDKYYISNIIMKFIPQEKAAADFFLTTRGEHFVHSDFTLSNVKIDSNREIFVCDFEHAKYGPKLYDETMMVYSMLKHGHFEYARTIFNAFNCSLEMLYAVTAMKLAFSYRDGNESEKKVRRECLDKVRKFYVDDLIEKWKLASNIKKSKILNSNRWAVTIQEENVVYKIFLKNDFERIKKEVDLLNKGGYIHAQLMFDEKNRLHYSKTKYIRMFPMNKDISILRFVNDIDKILQEWDINKIYTKAVKNTWNSKEKPFRKMLLEEFLPEEEFAKEYLETTKGEHFVHGDLKLPNIQYDESGNLLVIDFETACIGPLLWDETILVHSFIEENMVEYAKYVFSHYNCSYEMLYCVAAIRLATSIRSNRHDVEKRRHSLEIVKKNFKNI